MLFNSLARRVCSFFGVNVGSPTASVLKVTPADQDLLSRNSLPRSSEIDPASRDRHKNAALSVRSFLGGGFIGINLSDGDTYCYLDLKEPSRPWVVPPVQVGTSREGRIADLLSQIFPASSPLHGLFEANVGGAGVQLMHLPSSYREASATFETFDDALRTGAGINVMHANNFKLYWEPASQAGRCALFFRGKAASEGRPAQRPAWLINLTGDQYVYHRRSGDSERDDRRALPITDPRQFNRGAPTIEFREDIANKLRQFFEGGRQHDRPQTIQNCRGIILLALAADRARREHVLDAFWKVMTELQFDNTGVPLLAFYRRDSSSR